jgi:16S rRNA C967 or C1407 C5-methylase (RsmB/RsmF family)/NOL1/NOP2/fmu family ribosome biogenesis protein
MSSKLPPPFIRSLRDNYGLEEELLFETIEKSESMTSVRLNPFKPADLFRSGELVPWCANGRYLNDRPNFTADPFFHAGCYYVQEASSMFLEQALKATINTEHVIRVLDLCAAPGGKSTLISSLISQDSLLVSNEIIKTRVPVLTDNLNKWGPSNIFVSNNDPRDFKRLPGYFDTLIVDAPCSGSGMFRKDPAAISHWSESAVQLCSERQQRILADAYPSLKEQGTIIYSTCSYSRQENEDIADWLCEEFNMTPIRIPITETWGIQETISEKKGAYGYRFYPHKLKGEGLYMACFRKNDKTEETKARRANFSSINAKEEELIRPWLRKDMDLFLQTINDEHFALHPQHAGDLETLKTKLYLKKSGTRIGKSMKNAIIPHHELALSLINNPDTPKLNVNAGQALDYLKRNEIKADTDFRGWALVCFDSHPLGWAKVLDNRINNYFPKEMRIFNQKL